MRIFCNCDEPNLWAKISNVYAVNFSIAKPICPVCDFFPWTFVDPVVQILMEVKHGAKEVKTNDKEKV